MGYRLVPTRITYPGQLDSHKPMTIDMTWTNRAVGRAMRDFHLVLTLADKGGKTVATTDAGPVPTSRWIKGQNDRISNLKFQFPNIHALPPGQYNLRFGLRDGDRAIALPLPDQHEGTYPVGQIQVE